MFNTKCLKTYSVAIAKTNLIKLNSVLNAGFRYVLDWAYGNSRSRIDLFALPVIVELEDLQRRSEPWAFSPHR
jgi:hypothetical protein